MKSLLSIFVIGFSFAALQKQEFMPENSIAINAASNYSDTIQEKRKKGNPLDHLPANIQILTHFGERADFHCTINGLLS